MSRQKKNGFGTFLLVFIKAVLKTVKYLILVGSIAMLLLVIHFMPELKNDYEDAVKTVAASSSSTFSPDMASTVYDANNQVIAQLSNDKKKYSYLTYDSIPSNAINAFIAVEDQNFWTNKGYDPLGVFRSVFRYVSSRGKVISGASTITQQLCKLTFLNADRTLTRKIKEIMYADRMTKTYTKQEIMEFYVNNCCFANGIYGIQEAAKEYFGVDSSQLSLSQMAYLCAIPNQPEYYDPWKDPTKALKRRNKILNDMVKCGFISEADATSAKAETITVQAESQTSTDNSDSESTVSGDVSPQIALATKDYQTSYVVKCATEELMKKAGFTFQYSFNSDDEYNTYNKSYAAAYKTAHDALYSQRYEIHTSLDTSLQDTLQSQLDETLSSTKEKGDGGVFAFQGAMTVIDNNTGKVVAIIGGRSQEGITTGGSLNRAFQAYRQPGSTFKPILVYAPAIETGDYDADSDLKNIDVTAAKKSDNVKSMTGESMKLRYAVTHSINGAAYWLASQIGVDYGMQFIHKMCFSRIVPEDSTLSAALGGLTHGTTSLEMASAYRTFTNGGYYRYPTCITSMKDMNGTELYTTADEVSVYKQSTVDQMTDIMEGVFSDGGTASSIGWDNKDIDAAGKTGTTNDTRDKWFTGFTPYYTISVWTGYNDNRKISSGMTQYSLNIWKDAMTTAIEGKDPAHF
ncbi:MAG: transglycosylase domain-containing protein [Lachnospiraceae bacterium]|nr:transglycosylase domain-containing protein [Lachnospiraceae bacterium]